jgi:hypothetical protein
VRPGYLSVEHVNYFTEESLTRMLALAGYRVVGLAKEYEADLYPVVAATARPVEAPAVVESGPGEREEVRRRLVACIERERALWRGVDRQLQAEVERGARIHVWGAGVFASQLLANTDLARRAELVGAVDSSPQKQGATLGDQPVVAPGAAGLGPGDCVVVASFASADEIWRRLAPERSRGVRVVRLHGEPIGR